MASSVISASLSPALDSCFLALVTLAKELPTFLTAVALASSLITPTTLAAKAPATVFTVAAVAVAPVRLTVVAPAIASLFNSSASNVASVAVAFAVATSASDIVSPVNVFTLLVFVPHLSASATLAVPNSAFVPSALSSIETVAASPSEPATALVFGIGSPSASRINSPALFL